MERLLEFLLAAEQEKNQKPKQIHSGAKYLLCKCVYLEGNVLALEPGSSDYSSSSLISPDCTPAAVDAEGRVNKSSDAKCMEQPSNYAAPTPPHKD